MPKKYALVVYSRTGSKRFPNKALARIGDFKLIELIIKRLKQINQIQVFDIIVATTTEIEDNKIIKIAESCDVLTFQGDKYDLVKRTTDLLIENGYSWFCRINGDCPLVSPQLIMKGFDKIHHDYEFVTNINERSFPYGIAVEWVNSNIYMRYNYQVKKLEREHVTQHLYRHINDLNYYNMKNSINESNIKLTVDFPADLKRLNKTFDSLSPSEQITIDYKEFLKKSKNN